MSTEPLLSNRKASRIFFHLLGKRARLAGIASSCALAKNEAGKLLERMERTGLIAQQRGAYEVDWERFVPMFVGNAMGIYSAAMPWKYIPYYMERDPESFVEASCARAERELARIKVKLAGNDLFFRLVQGYFHILATELSDPDDYLEDLRIMDAIEEFEYGLLKLLPLVKRRGRKDPSSKELIRLLADWYRRIQSYDSPSGAALRAAFGQVGLLDDLG
ncbi:MAG: hypothetical protein JXR96_07290 [Deltaproteobacteria bacterium]|nr:hypothetical protein [Deltaproteobacteria bacterium]